eukprot:CAMPEP_0172635298 /NCGR_PEP_ID=MMETSP1068-20121228/198725_1 /TAXON_ID=35684 /ORGANISM="Pseudopedinella elastica, Strain CCMP716" /LENGTH=38 /DNA_ID= /DNA_START= /DNA_END= /DNA_ORIENTATION=
MVTLPCFPAHRLMCSASARACSSSDPRSGAWWARALTT